MRPLTLVLPYYDNPGMLRHQLRYWSRMPANIQSHLRVIIVDDGSPRTPAADVCKAEMPAWVDVSLYRVTVDVRWNWIAARNLAMHHAPDGWCLMTDMDHIVPTRTWHALMMCMLDEQRVYRFQREDAIRLDPLLLRPSTKPHPNTWFLTRAMFETVGGYDERFSGHYGSDGEFRDRVEKKAKRVVIRSDIVVRVPRELVPDASTTTYTRKDPRLDVGKVKRIREERDRAKLAPLRLTFPWERVF